MSNTAPPVRSIKELALGDSDELKLYLELIRIIEKDIDEIKASDTRNGWTTWAILGGIAGSLLVFFSESRKIDRFPSEQVALIILVGALFYCVAVTLPKILYYDTQNIRPGRLRWSTEAYFSFIPSALYSLLILITLLGTTIWLPLSLVVKIVSAAAFTFWAILTALVLVASKVPFPFGNNRISKKSGLGMGLVSVGLSLLAFGLLVIRIPPPIGELGTAPFIFAGLTLVIILLIGYLIFKTAPSRLLTDLQDLRNDIIFLRVEIDEALRRYETLSEGQTLPDALKQELSDIVKDLNLIEYAHTNMSSLIEKMKSELPVTNDDEATKQQKSKQFILDRDSYHLHDQKCSETLNSLQRNVDDLTKKLGRLSAVTEDRASESTIRSLLFLRIQSIQANEAQLKQQVDQVIRDANNPPKGAQQLPTSRAEDHTS